MKPKNLALEIAVVMACYLIITIPVTSATSVNIIFNGQVMETVEYEPSDIINQHITYVKDARDISWSDVSIAITLNSASLAHTIKKVYLYKCGSLSPVGCMQKTPEVFDSYVDTEIAWDDIGQSTGSTKYPQEGNLLFIVKLEDSEGMTSWVGLWNTIKRTSHREFLFFRRELPEVDVYASSSRLVDPIAYYIQNFNVIPFNWLTKASFDDALSISAIGGDNADLDTSPPALQSVEPSSNDIDVINKENYFVFPETSGGFSLPITLQQNPDFVCGDGDCETSLGEDEETCCYDCGCQNGYYCDAVQGSPETGNCRNPDLIDLDVVGTPSAEVSDCSHSFEVSVTARINNLPASISGEGLTGTVKIQGVSYATQCEAAGTGLYECTLSMSPTIQCGSGTRQSGPNELGLSVTYRDGMSTVTRKLNETFPSINLNYDCTCGSGYYCDTGTETCESESAITLGITELTSYLDSYTPGDTIDLTAKVFNPPTGMVLVSPSAGLNLTNGIVSPGTPQCTGPNEDFEYECSIPFSITGYQKSENYRFYPNYLSFEITYNDGTVARTMGLTTEFGPLSIPSQECGNNVCDVDESYENCCQDCGCEASGDYCDVARGCSPLDEIGLSTVVYPRELEDCKTTNEVNIQATIENAPYDTVLDYKSLTVNYQPVPWSFECPVHGSVGGVFDCMLEIPELEGCELPYYTVGPNGLEFTISFPNGDDEGSTISRILNATVDDIYVTPVPHIDGECEASLGENGSTACLDCPCGDDPDFGTGYYCDFGINNPEGTCLPKSDIGLVVESPTSPVWFQSCEEMNRVNVVMHVQNQPSSDMDIENRFATLGGEAAQYMSCTEISELSVSENGSLGYPESTLTLNCTIGIPPVDTCSQGHTYNYSDNSISFIISYENGEQGKVLQTITTDIPDIYTYQTIRSLHDITEQAMSQMRGVLDNIMSITENMMDTIQKCIEMQMIMFMMNIAFSLIMGFAGGGAFTEEADWSWRGFSEGVSAGGQIGSQFASMLGNICDALQKMAEIEIKLQEMQMEKIQMETCLAVAQHALDSGDCRGQEQACFDNIVNCLGSITEISDIADDIGELSESISEDFVEANDAISDAGDALAEGPWSDDSVSQNRFFSITLQDNLDDNAMVCEYNGFLVTGDNTRCRDTDTTAYVSIGTTTTDCSRDRLVLTVNKKVVLAVETGGSDVRVERQVANFMSYLNKGESNSIELYCTDENPVTGIDITGDTGYRLRASMSAARGEPDQASCSCTYGGSIFQGVQQPAEALTTETEPSKCDFARDAEFILLEDSQLGMFYTSGSAEYFRPYNWNQEDSCKVKDSYDIGADVLIKTTSDSGYKYVNGREYWKVEVETSSALEDCGDNTVGWMEVYHNDCYVGQESTSTGTTTAGEVDTEDFDTMLRPAEQWPPAWLQSGYLMQASYGTSYVISGNYEFMLTESISVAYLESTDVCDDGLYDRDSRCVLLDGSTINVYSDVDGSIEECHIEEDDGYVEDVYVYAAIVRSVPEEGGEQFEATGREICQPGDLVRLTEYQIAEFCTITDYYSEAETQVLEAGYGTSGICTEYTLSEIDFSDREEYEDPDNIDIDAVVCQQASVCAYVGDKCGIDSTDSFICPPNDPGLGDRLLNPELKQIESYASETELSEIYEDAEGKCVIKCENVKYKCDYYNDDCNDVFSDDSVYCDSSDLCTKQDTTLYIPCQEAPSSVGTAI